MPQVEIWELPGQPLRKLDIQANGYESLKDYVLALAKDHAGHMRVGCVKCMRVASEPLVSFGKFDPKTGSKLVMRTCLDENSLPTENIPDVLEL